MKNPHHKSTQYAMLYFAISNYIIQPSELIAIVNEFDINIDNLRVNMLSHNLIYIEEFWEEYQDQIDSYK